MDIDLKIGVIGGDLRQLVAAVELAEDGIETAVYAFDEYRGPVGCAIRCVSLEDTIRNSKFIILPLPVSVDKIHLNTPLSRNEIHLDYLFSLLSPDQILVGGKFDAISNLFAQEKNIKIHDYYTREELAVMNSIPTAEGAINIAMQELSTTVSGANVLVLGYGRIGKVLAHRLKSLNANVTVAARKHEDFAWIDVYGYKRVSYPQLGEHISEFNLIFNTVPHLMLDKPMLEKADPECLIIDLSSNPGGYGFDWDNAKNAVIQPFSRFMALKSLVL